MVNIEICRKTGKRSIQCGGQTDDVNLMLDKLADLIIDWGINAGAIKYEAIN